MSENHGKPLDELDPVQAALNRAVSRRTLLRRAALGGAALTTPALLAACDIGDDDGEEAAGTETAARETGEQRNLTYYSVTHGESGNVFWAIYRNGIFCTILDQNAVDGPLRQAIEGGIPVIAVNVPDTRPQDKRIPYLFYVGGDEEAGGRLTAQRQRQEGNVQHAVCVIHEPGHTGLEARCRGYDAELTKAGARVDKLPSSKDATQATEQIKSFLQRNTDVDAIFGVGPQPATFALQALEELGKKGEVRVSAYDMTEDLLTEINGDNLVSTIDQQQYLQSWEPIHWLTQHIEHGFVLAPGVDMLTGPALVDKSNASKVAEGVKAGFR